MNHWTEGVSQWVHLNLDSTRLLVSHPTCLWLASFPGSCAWAGRKELGTHCLRMLSFPRISGNLEISVKCASLH